MSVPPSFSPIQGEVGSTVSLTGTGLAAITAVTFPSASPQGIQATIESRGEPPNDTWMTVVVPSGALSGTISVTIAGQPTQLFGQFSVSMVICEITPGAGLPGDPVTIWGSGLYNAASVTFGGASAQNATTSSEGNNDVTCPNGLTCDSAVTTTVPPGAQTGIVQVIPMGQGMAADSPLPFIVV